MTWPASFPIMFRRRIPGEFGNQPISVLLPYDFNPSGMGDGPLPSPWGLSTTFSISGGVIYNTPSTGSNVLTDPSLEAAYVTGLCGTLSKTGSPTVADETVDVHAGSHAQAFTATAQNNAVSQSAGSKAAGWWRYYRYCKRTAGTSGNAKIRIFPSGGTVLPATSGSVQDDFVKSAAYAKRQVSALVVSASTLLLYLIDGGVASWDTILEDDGSLHTLTAADLIATVPSNSRLATVKIIPGSYVDGTWFGFVAWYTDANNYVMVLAQPNSINSNYFVTLIQVVAGTASSLIAPTGVTYSAGAWLELRPTDSDTVGLYYNNAQVSTDKDINAAITGTAAGLINTGGNGVNRFFVG